VRARLLPPSATEPGADRYVRKAKELIQASRLTEAFPGEDGKKRIITAYLNEIFYGHDAYGIAAAAQVYFGITDLKKLTPAQAALLAGLPQSPSLLDPYLYAEPDAEGRLVVTPGSAPIVRRDWVLDNLGASRWTRLSRAQIEKAKKEPVILYGDQPLRYRAPHFTWQVRRQLEAILGSADAVDTGGYRVVTSLDWDGQKLAEKWLRAAVIAPNRETSKQTAALLETLKVPSSDRSWITALRGKDLHNAALVALDYRTGDVLTYAGSAGYYEEGMASKKFDPKYDAAGDGARQPGSAFKPIVYAAGFEKRKLTPGTLLLDITTEFNEREEWAPRNADQAERGPVLVRKALQKSLNIPAIRALDRIGNEAVADVAERLGLRFTGGRTAFLQSGLAGAIGTVEVRPIDLTSAFGAFGNGGVRVPPRMILEIYGPDGSLFWKAPEPAGTKAVSPGTAYLVSDILAGNTDPSQNPSWAEKLELRNGPDGQRRPAAAKTGTANDARDLATYGFLPRPRDADQPGLAVGIWMGNSDHSFPRARDAATSIDAAAPLWRAFVRDYSGEWPVADFEAPKGVVAATIDKWSGGLPGPWTQGTIREYFLEDTQPGASHAVDPSGLLYRVVCGSWRVDPLKAELGPSDWDDDVADWLARARRGAGVVGKHESRTTYLTGESTWGGQLAGPCYVPRSVFRYDPRPAPRRQPPGNPGGGGGGIGGGGGNAGGGNGNGNGNGGGGNGGGNGNGGGGGGNG
jgi:membrane peptidoglycan carboxypeptidase